MTSDIRSLIVHRPIFDAIYQQARSDGMQTLLDDGIKKVEAGIISLRELGRAIL